MVKVKTSIYVDKELWKRFRKYAMSRGVEVSKLLEDAIRDELLEDALVDALMELAGSESYEIDFEPVEPREGLVSELVRVMRDERADRIPRQ
ncbi:MAG: CopG family transcriptional regulator [Thermoprotei archaeon]|nr:MAG: CopG family transcriptional regulator [Thermoprotei archaeon]